MKEALFGKSLSELQQIAVGCSLPKYAAGQMADWLYKKNISSIDEMSNLTKKARNTLASSYCIGIKSFEKELVSSDGTKKYLFPTLTGRFVETAFIPDKDRATLCLSMQVGCKMSCFFCMTGKQGFQGNLTAGEILNQYKSLPGREKLTNIVYMGMGEPLDNFKEVMKSLEVFTAAWGFAMSPRRITVSTIGIMPAVENFIEQSECHLAISLHSPFEYERQRMMPVQQTYPVSDIIETIKKYNWTGQRRVSFEYIMFKNLNDTEKHVNELAKLLNGIKCRINLIKWHNIPGTNYHSSDEATINMFKDKLNQKGILTTIRASRGQDIEAACGLLSTNKKIKS